MSSSRAFFYRYIIAHRRTESFICIQCEFSIELASISQETVDKNIIFIELLNKFQEFMTKYELFQAKSAAFVTDGPFDICNFITK